MSHEQHETTVAETESAGQAQGHHEDAHHHHEHDHHHHEHSKFYLDIEGKVHPWPVETVIPEQVAELGGWPISLGVLEIDADNNERTVPPGEIIHLKPGHQFAKKVHWKRGR
jgi:hypothetical protein